MPSPTNRSAERTYFSAKTTRSHNGKGVSRRPTPPSPSSSGSLTGCLKCNYKYSQTTPSLLSPSNGPSPSAEHRSNAQQDSSSSLKFLSVPKMMEEEESPMTNLDDFTSSPLQQHMDTLLRKTSVEISELKLVSDNARLAPTVFRSSPGSDRRSPIIKSVSDKTVLNKSKYRPCRWTSEYSPRPESINGLQQHYSPSSAMRQGPPPMSPPLRSPNSLPGDWKLQSEKPAGIASYSSPSHDMRPVLPTRSTMDLSDHCTLPDCLSAVRRPNHSLLQRQTSDSVLTLPERRDSREEISIEQVSSCESAGEY